MTRQVNREADIRRIARDRTAWLLKKRNLATLDLPRLVEDAYLQGISDGARVAFENGFIPPGSAPAAPQSSS